MFPVANGRKQCYIWDTEPNKEYDREDFYLIDAVDDTIQTTVCHNERHYAYMRTSVVDMKDDGRITWRWL